MGINIYQWYKDVKKSVTSIKWKTDWSLESAYLEKLRTLRTQKPDIGLFDSICQYKCQVFQENWFSIFMLQAVSLSSLLYLVFKSVRNKVQRGMKCDVAYFYSLSIFSPEQRQQNTFGFVGQHDIKLTGKDLFWLFQYLLRSSFNFTIISTTAFRIGQIRFALEKYSITEIWSNMEYSPSCGLVYEYCQAKGLKLKNFMHGEKVLTIKDAFTRFDEFYVWDLHYKSIFATLQCNAEIMISNPWKTEKPKNHQNKSNKICYILNGIETIDELTRIDEFLSVMEMKGYQIYFKKHPRQPNSDIFNNKFKEFTGFKDNHIDDLYVFDYVVAQYSTILLQCFYNNQEIILDDYANPDRIQALKQRSYIFFSVNAMASIQKVTEQI